MAKLYQPSKKQIQISNLYKFEKIIEKTYKKKFPNYLKLWDWSVKKPDYFWNTVIDFFDVSIIRPKFFKAFKKNSKFWRSDFYDKCKINYYELISRNTSLDLAIHFIGENG